MAARLTPEVLALRAVTERQWQGTVEKLMTAHGWRFYHPPDNRPITAGSGRKYVQNVRAGFPDLFAVRGQQAIAIELKTEIGKTSPEQDVWLLDLVNAGIPTYVWRPSDLAEVQTILARKVV